MGKPQLSKSSDKLDVVSELNDINSQIIPLKEIEDKQCASIYGLTEMVYTRHIDTYMHVSIKKAEILACLKRQKLSPCQWLN